MVRNVKFDTVKFAQQLGISDTVAKLMVNRGIYNLDIAKVSPIFLPLNTTNTFIFNYSILYFIKYHLKYILSTYFIIFRNIRKY